MPEPESIDLNPLLDRIGHRLGTAAAQAEFEAWAAEQTATRLRDELEQTRQLLEQANARIAELEG